MNRNSRLHRSIVPILLASAVPVSGAFLSPASSTTTARAERFHLTSHLFSSSSNGGGDAVSALPPMLDSTGKHVVAEDVSEKLRGKRVAYYFGASWCPMCTTFEPSLLQFRQAANDSGKEIELIYVSSDRSEDAAVQRADSMEMLMVSFGEESDKLKKKLGIWSGSEGLKLGFLGRRSGVPALIVLDSETGGELAFLPAESQGVAALNAWPLDDNKGIWKN